MAVFVEVQVRGNPYFDTWEMLRFFYKIIQNIMQILQKVTGFILF